MLQSDFMKGLLVAATSFEIKPVLGRLKKNANWNVIISGVGGVATAYSLAKSIGQAKPDILVQAGIGGCFDPTVSLGSVFAIKSDLFGDLGVIEQRKRKTLFDLGFIKPDERPYRQGKLFNPNKNILKACLLPTADAVTVNEITTAKADADHFRTEWSATVESMEGAAFHFVALKEKIPFIQIRAISNYVGERNKKKWDMEAAIRNLNLTINELIERL